ncbi:hypothetical protein [Alloactinosynnema sp. L-07]|uniref:hypothetical protein n=1 Tax=Alloactinosynnema sp. L-07 TaxID=1653480 RepID=UPI00065EFE9C|nr:hypothetical protein [Alloactinosynnema sp. L-07]CRK59620.1 hypothetical protein [Alloactinosynnema sp. L-07]
MYVDDAGGAAIGESVSKFLSAAKSGGFAVNETGGQALLDACRGLRDWIDEQQVELQQLARQPMLGSSVAAEVMKPHIEAVATDDRGLITQLLALRHSLAEAEEAIRTAMSNYRNTDQSGASSLNPMD